MSVVPHLMAFALLAFWTALGWSGLRAIRVRMDRLRMFLIAPIFGVALVVLPTVWLNAAGLPVSMFGRPLGAMLLLLAGVGVAKFGGKPSARQTALVLAPVLLSMMIAGAPALVYGVDWIANTNDDWANENLAAIRLLNGGHFTRPDIAAVDEGANYPGYYWFLLVGTSGRTGSVMMLAWAASIFGLNPFFVFMPVILAMHGALVMGATSLALTSKGANRPLVIGMLLTAISPLGIYAVAQQLNAQIAGLAFLTSLASLTFVPIGRLIRWSTVIAGGIFAAAFLIVYPEAVPFFGLAFLLYHAMHVRELSRVLTGPMIARLAMIGVVAVALSGPFFVNFLVYLKGQISIGSAQGLVDGEYSIFPYFVIPSGPSLVWGLFTFGEIPPEPRLSIVIAASFILSAIGFIAIAYALRHSFRPAVVLAVMVFVGSVLILQGQNFGLFKLAMFVQSFLWFVVAYFIFRIVPRIGATIVLLGFGLVMVQTTVHYVLSSSGELRFGFAATPSGSKNHLLSEALGGGEPRNSRCNVAFEAASGPIIRIHAGNVGCVAKFVSRDAFASLIPGPSWNPLLSLTGEAKVLEDATAKLLALRPETVLKFPTRDGDLISTKIAKPVRGLPNIGIEGNAASIFNGDEGSQPRIVAAESLRNYLIFIHSSLGNHYYSSDTKLIAYYGIEQDYFYPGRPTTALGRYLLFRVNEPSSSVRLLVDLSTTALGESFRDLPRVSVAGGTAVDLGVVGKGSARVMSPPLQPLTVDGLHYLLLDLGRDGAFIQTKRTGLMKLYGTSVPIDYRRVVAFGRRIQLVDGDALNPDDIPDAVSSFPAGLANPRLEYSGLYEDGWVGGAGFLTLSGRPGAKKMVVRGMLPAGIGLDSVDVTLQVNHGSPVRRTLKPGNFEIELPAGSGPQRLDFAFSALGELPNGDGRPVTVLLSSVAMEGSASVETPDAIRSFPAGLANPRLEYSGLYEDGWVGEAGFLTLSGRPGATKMVVRGMFPAGIGLDSVDVTLQVNHGSALRRTLKPGNFEIELPAGSGPQRLDFQFSAMGQLPGGDGRWVTVLLSSVAMEAPESHEAPDAIREFPADLANPRLEHSGLYQDGWIGDAGFIVLFGGPNAKRMVIRGLLPEGIGLASVDATFQVNDAEAVRQTLAPGTFEIVLPAGPGSQRLDFRFSALGKLPEGDGRPVTVRLLSVALEN